MEQKNNRSRRRGKAAPASLFSGEQRGSAKKLFFGDEIRSCFSCDISPETGEVSITALRSGVYTFTLFKGWANFEYPAVMTVTVVNEDG